MGDVRLGFDWRVRQEFHGSKISSDGGLLLFRELDEVLGLHNIAGGLLRDTRTGRNRSYPDGTGARGGHTDVLMIDATHLKAHRTASNLGLKKGADVYFGRDKAILQQRERIKQKTFEERRLHHSQRAA